MKLWVILLAVGLAAAAAGIVAVAVWVLLRRSDRRIAAYQNKLLARQIAEVENLYLTMRGWRHDYHNHLQTLKAAWIWARPLGPGRTWTIWRTIWTASVPWRRRATSVWTPS